MEEIKKAIIEEAKRAKKAGLTKRQFIFVEIIAIFFGFLFVWSAIITLIIFFEKI